MTKKLINPPSARFIYLADRPDLIPVLAGWFFEEWGGNNRNLTLETFECKLQLRLNRDHAPLVLVMMCQGSPIASASLKIREMDTHPQHTHWLGSVYVLAEHRGLGLGSQLVQQAVKEAKRLGIRELYLYTRSKESFYTRLGWKSVEKPQYHGRKVIIMNQILSV